MFDFLKKKPEPVSPKPRDSLFSTHVEVPEKPADADLSDYIQRLAFPRGNTLTAVGTDGKPVKGDGKVAMDAAPNAGNPGSLKPLLGNEWGGVPLVQLGWYGAQTFIGYQICGIIAQHWLVNKACTMPARDAMRHGYEITVNDGTEIDPKMLQKIRSLDKKYALKKNCVEMVRMNRIFGIRVVMFKVETDDPEQYYINPFNIDGVKPGSYKGISQIDPYWITPELDASAAADPSAIDFYEPTWWRVNGMRVHKSHLIVLKNATVIDVLKPSYIYGGVSIPQQIHERVYAAERTANEAPMLAMTKRTTIWHMDMAAAVANQSAFEQKMAWFSAVRDNYGVKAMGIDDKAEQFDTSLADLDAVIMTQYQIVAAIAEVPATKLLGTSPKGFNATGEFESDSYHEFLESIQEHDIEPLLDHHYMLLMKSEGLDIEVTINWHSVDTPSAKELAEINFIKSQTATNEAGIGAIDGEDERQRLIADKESGYNGMSDIVPDKDEILPEHRSLKLAEETAAKGDQEPDDKDNS